MKILSLHTIALLSLLNVSCNGARLLFLNVIGTKSHKQFFSAIANTLAERGHNVTMVSSHPPTNRKLHIREIILEEFDLSTVMPNVFTEPGGNTPIISLAKSTPSICTKALATKEMKELSNEKFDLIFLSVFLNFCFLSLVHKMEVPFIWLSPHGMQNPCPKLIGSPNFPAVSPSPLIGYHFPLAFHQRFISTLVDSIGMPILWRANLYWQDSECRKNGLCPLDMPSLSHLAQNASLLFLNSVKHLANPPKVDMPNVIHLGGIHCSPPNPLPKELDEWVRGSGEHGFIYFSLGSAVKTEDLPEEYRKIFVEVFSQFPQRVIWKWDGEMDDLPTNVKIGKWFPQQDLLGHRHLRLFITHGGLFSTLEATFHAVPVLGIPVFGDQSSNMREIEEQGCAKLLAWQDLTKDTLKDRIRTLIYNESFHKAVQRRSKFMRDQPMKPDDEAAFWVEYVLRHNGAHHLKSPFLQISWYAMYNIDVWICLLIIASGLIYISTLLLTKFADFLINMKRKEKRTFKSFKRD